MEYKFIVNTENVNSYGYRILTSGIDTTQYEKNPVVLFMHNRGEENPTGDEVIGKSRIVKEGDRLLAYITFDSENDFAKKIEKKVGGDFIRMCSMHAEVVETSSDLKLILPGQKYETVTKCKLLEISIVDIGGNDDALRLSLGDNVPKIKLLNQKKENHMSTFKTLALALGKASDASEEELLKTINELKLAKETSDKEAKQWKEKYLDIQNIKANEMLEKAVALGLLPEDLKEAQLKAFESDFQGQSTKLSKLIKEKEEENSKNSAQSTIGLAVALSKGAKQNIAPANESFDYLQKHNKVELARIREEEPQKYAKLVKEYASGVRYQENNNNIQPNVN